MQQTLQPNPQAYPSFHHFFIRQLKPSCRPITHNKQAIACPADGTISQVGEIKQDLLLQAKGLQYTLCDLLGGYTNHAAQFHNGYFNTIYLAPKNYHRVHMPYLGCLRQMIYVPGKLFSVKPHTANTIPGLFAQNERAVCLFDTEIGPMAIILVGAVIVASLHTQWHGRIIPSAYHKIHRWEYANQSIWLARGAEMGYFTLGSTVILLFAESSQLRWCNHLQPGFGVKYGQALGIALKNYQP